MNSITILRPDDWHLHVRDGEQMRAVVPHTARQFARAIIMPNLKPPIVTTDMALAYRAHILAALPEALQSGFEPLMTLYLTDKTSPSEIIRAKESGQIHGVKLYPAVSKRASLFYYYPEQKSRINPGSASRQGIHCNACWPNCH